MSVNIAIIYMNRIFAIATMNSDIAIATMNRVVVVGWSVMSVCVCIELKIRQKKGLLSKDAILLAIDDPKPNIGSGSATLNAMLCVAEYLAAREGMTVRKNDALVVLLFIMLCL